MDILPMDQFDPEEEGEDLGDATQCFNCGIVLSTRWIRWDEAKECHILHCPECGEERVVEI
jgi:hypothetical protein